MRSQGQLVLAALLITAGVVLLIGSVLEIDVWALCWPIGVILLGLWLLFRPRLVSGDTAVRQKLIGDIRRVGAWQVADEEYWLGIGDVKLDMSDAEIPLGETRIRVWGFVGGIKVSVPQDVGVSVSSSAFVTDVRLFGRKRDGILVPVQMTSEDYETAERKIRLETTSFVGDVKVRQA